MRPHRCGVLLAGGAGTRFGGAPKGLAPVGDRRVADGPLRALQATCADVLIAANDSTAPQWFPGFRIVADREPGRGALGALETALHASDAETIVVCAWDMPFVTAEVLDALAVTVEAGAACAVPVHPDGHHEPLCAAYGRQCAPWSTSLLQGGEHAAHALLQVTHGVDWPISAHLAPQQAERVFFNINTPDDLMQAAGWVEERGTVP